MQKVNGERQATKPRLDALNEALSGAEERIAARFSWLSAQVSFDAEDAGTLLLAFKKHDNVRGLFVIGKDHQPTYVTKVAVANRVRAAMALPSLVAALLDAEVATAARVEAAIACASNTLPEVAVDAERRGCGVPQ